MNDVGRGDHSQADAQSAVVQGRAASAAFSAQRLPHAEADVISIQAPGLAGAADPQADRTVFRVQDQHGADQLVHGDADDKATGLTCTRSAPGGNGSCAITVRLVSRCARLPKYRSPIRQGARIRGLLDQFAGQSRAGPTPSGTPKT